MNKKLTPHTAAVRLPGALRAAQEGSSAGLADATTAATDALVYSARDGDEDEQVDEDAVDKANENTRLEPLAWQNLADDVVIEIDRHDEEASTGTSDKRVAFLRNFICMVSRVFIL